MLHIKSPIQRTLVYVRNAYKGWVLPNEAVHYFLSIMFPPVSPLSSASFSQRTSIASFHRLYFYTHLCSAWHIIHSTFCSTWIQKFTHLYLRSISAEAFSTIPFHHLNFKFLSSNAFHPSWSPEPKGNWAPCSGYLCYSA